MQITLLGTGTSHGVPVPGCSCKTCLSQDQRDIRYRCGAYIWTEDTGILIDTPPEFRLQALKYQIPRIDLVLMTHNHADHVSGFDDLRRYNELQKEAIPVYGNGPCLAGIKGMFPYIFDDAAQIGGGKPQVNLIETKAPFIYQEKITIIPLEVQHGRLAVNGYRIGKMAYVTDCNFIPKESMELLEGLELLILGVLRFRTHATHFNLEAGLRVIQELKPRRSLLTHICHDFKFAEMTSFLPPRGRARL